MAWFFLKEVSTSSQEQEAEFLEIYCSDGKLSERLNARNTRGKFSSRDRRMAYCPVSPSGMTLLLSDWITEKRKATSDGFRKSGMISLSAEDSHVRMSPLQTRMQRGLTGNAPAFGLRCSESLARFDRDACLWRTLQPSLFGDLTECLETLPRSGMTADGLLSGLMMSVRRTSANVSGFLGKEGGGIPTPIAHDAKGHLKEESLVRKDGKGLRLDQLPSYVFYVMEGGWRTPTKSDTGGGQSMETLKRMTEGDWLRPSGQRMQLTLRDQVREPGLYPKQAAAGKLPVKGNLNPDWVEWLMGWPVGWTDLKPLSMDAVNEWMTRMLRHEWWNTDPGNDGSIPRLTECNTHRLRRIECLGNGQVPLCVRDVTLALEEL